MELPVRYDCTWVVVFLLRIKPSCSESGDVCRFGLLSFSISYIKLILPEEVQPIWRSPKHFILFEREERLDTAYPFHRLPSYSTSFVDFFFSRRLHSIVFFAVPFLHPTPAVIRSSSGHSCQAFFFYSVRHLMGPGDKQQRSRLRRYPTQQQIPKSHGGEQTTSFAPTGVVFTFIRGASFSRIEQRSSARFLGDELNYR